ncbi:3-hydroxyacyl-CoA dehydrogenase/enoyl-CoA hydratase family protein [Phototrophicus methaneseepsis]|uniref:3-hydroxyacyl-CoA dehydrogenase/enoyl-CoA hydratase family protein n=1 Tax=Phototrophicus methaneseepsis TaxID=2710758 RepID=A0A7S8IDW8_9CHLR|nr:3-hydroxyacyl-CoA dehydrogenase/enoyl-CoA hydratase family protein [Phototrophicus methaneseepsis]QPC81976.1 3-hydroxyacyl-CoA dehydrogenase/enoyl-CoA hydratase family protein [Phototrophicus methaneseepsis]
MTYQIKKAAVIGSGTMGGGIAALLAGVGIPTLLLDIPAKESQPGDPASQRNAIVEGNLKTLQKMRPAQLFSADDISRISIGNIEDDLEKVADVDWVIEVVVERLDIKRNLMAKLAEVVNGNTIVSTNTSGLPISQIAEGLPESFRKRFLGTHFFNPPRYLRLLEVIPTPDTDPELVNFMLDFGSRTLGKGVVVAKDTPNFIGNRFMSMSGMQAMNYALDHDYTVEEVDALTGPLIGRPKTATFNLNDLVGFDIAVHVARNLYPNIPDDSAREVLNHPAANALSDYMLENNQLGRKTDKGFYWMRREDGKKELWALNLKTREYEPPSKVSFDSVKEHGKVKPLGERIRLLMNADDRAGQFLWHMHAFYLAYASNRVPEITESIVNIDNAQKWGFGHEMGPFEIWDAIGVSNTIDAFEEAGYPVAQWVKDMVASGKETFYQKNEAGKVIGYYSPQASDYVPLERDPMAITIADLQADGKQIWSNGAGNLYDMGDGVLLWEFATKQNTITQGFIDAGYHALEILEAPEWKALVIGNDAERFSIGANLMEVLQGIQEYGIEGLDAYIKRLQYLTMDIKYASKPVVVAAFNMALGGGAEMIMSGNAVVAHAELYMGLVEVGVGIVPAGGGCKELVRRLINPVASSGSDDLLAPMQKAFENIATAKVSESAKQAREMGFLAATDKIIMNRGYLLGEAKAHALSMANSYDPGEPEKVYAAGRDLYSALLVAVEGFKEAGYASEYDGVIAQKVARILTGGALSQPQWLSQDVFLSLERAAFMELFMETKSQERMMYMLQNNKPLRN